MYIYTTHTHTPTNHSPFPIKLGASLVHFHDDTMLFSKANHGRIDPERERGGGGQRVSSLGRRTASINHIHMIPGGQGLRTAYNKQDLSEILHLCHGQHRPNRTGTQDTEGKRRGGGGGLFNKGVIRGRSAPPYPSSKKGSKQGRAWSSLFIIQRAHRTPTHYTRSAFFLYNPVLWFERAEDGRIFQTLQYLSLVYTTLARAGAKVCATRTHTHFVV